MERIWHANTKGSTIMDANQIFCDHIPLEELTPSWLNKLLQVVTSCCKQLPAKPIWVIWSRWEMTTGRQTKTDTFLWRWLTHCWERCYKVSSALKRVCKTYTKKLILFVYWFNLLFTIIRQYVNLVGIFTITAIVVLQWILLLIISTVLFFQVGAFFLVFLLLSCYLIALRLNYLYNYGVYQHICWYTLMQVGNSSNREKFSSISEECCQRREANESRNQSVAK